MKNLVAVLVVIVGVLAFNAFFVVAEGTRAIVITFGKVAQTAEGETRIYAPGFHLKIPFVDRVERLDARVQTLDERADRFGFRPAA